MCPFHNERTSVLPSLSSSKDLNGTWTSGMTDTNSGGSLLLSIARLSDVGEWELCVDATVINAISLIHP